MRAAEGLDLALEDLVIGEVVGDGRDGRGVGRQRQGRQGPPGAAEASRQLGCEVLGVGSTAAVAEDDELAARVERVTDVSGQLRGVGQEGARGGRGRQVLVEDGVQDGKVIVHGDHGRGSLGRPVCALADPRAMRCGSPVARRRLDARRSR